MAQELTNYLNDKRALVDHYLRHRLLAAGDCPPALMEAMRYGLLAPGKRLRPLLVILAAEAGGGRDVDALPAAGAVEMIHAYSLIHDDLPAMDDDDLRRGQPTCHKQFGEALAILAGDALLTLAFQVLAEGYPPATAAACCRELARGAGAAGLVGGQIEDLAWEKSVAGAQSLFQKREGEAPAEPLAAGNSRPEPRPPGNRPSGTDSQRVAATLTDLEAVHARKTGALFRACLRLGVYAAQGERPGGPDPRLLESLDAYGRCFGQAFQITDDLLDVVGSVEQTGKRVGKDAARGKLTYPGFLGVEESRRRADQLCRQAQDHLAPLGGSGGRLADLAQFILVRDR